MLNASCGVIYVYHSAHYTDYMLVHGRVVNEPYDAETETFKESLETETLEILETFETETITFIHGRQLRLFSVHKCQPTSRTRWVAWHNNVNELCVSWYPDSSMIARHAYILPDSIPTAWCSIKSHRLNTWDKCRLMGAILCITTETLTLILFYFCTVILNWVGAKFTNIDIGHFG